ncbi:MAG: HAD-IIIA family hydrolase [Rhodospirillaceae bacterium]
MLLDRDGVINIDHGYVGSIERFDFRDGVFALARRAVDLGYTLAVITNQSGIARNAYSESDFQLLSRWMGEQFERQGARIACVLHCPYLYHATVASYARDSFWRKPNPGMILEAERILDLVLERSIFLGDQTSDMAAAAAAGVGLRVLIRPSNESKAGLPVIPSDVLLIHHPDDLRARLTTAWT